MRPSRNEYVGVLAAIASSALGGVAGGTTRFAIGMSDPVTLGVFRFGVGFLLLLPIALALRIKWPRGRDWLGVAALGVMYFAFFIVLFNLAFRYTTAARGSLALSTLPLMTMRRAWRRGARYSQKRRRDHRHGRGRGRTRHRPCERAGRGLARRPDHDRGHAGDGALQRVVASVHRSLEPLGVCHRRNGVRRGVPRGRGRLE